MHSMVVPLFIKRSHDFVRFVKKQDQSNKTNNPTKKTRSMM